MVNWVTITATKTKSIPVIINRKYQILEYYLNCGC